MTNEEIQKHIEQNCRNEHGEPMMDEQSFYEGAKWMRDKALSLGDVVGQSEQFKCDCCNGTGMVEGEHYNDLQSCNTCLGRGTF